MKRRHGYVLPLLLITIGFILLFDKLGLINRELWGSLLHYWPVVLILWGIEIIARNTESDMVYFTAVFISILIIIITVLLAWNGYPPPDTDFDFADLRNAFLDDENLDFVYLKKPIAKYI